MTGKSAMTPSIKSSNLSKPEKVACPKCDASLMFYRSDKPHIDECGFESYSLKCRACGSMLVGIIDPADDALLLTVCSYVEIYFPDSKGLFFELKLVTPVECSATLADPERPPKLRFRRNTITLAIDLLTYNCASMTKIQTKKSGRRR
jgi:hypothetical protein